MVRGRLEETTTTTVVVGVVEISVVDVVGVVVREVVRIWMKVLELVTLLMKEQGFRDVDLMLVVE